MFEYIPLRSGSLLESTERFRPFKCVVLISEDVTAEWQQAVSRWLVASGCLYMMAWGVECSSWDDSVDLANLEQFDFGEIPDAEFVMTTWHRDEPLEDVFHFAKFAANHPTVEVENLVVLDIGLSGRGSMFHAMWSNPN
jgi:hypothetical protein